METKHKTEIYNSQTIFQDKSDETNCEKVVFGDTYQSYLPPPTLENQNKFHVNLSIEVMDIQNINEVDKTFQVPYTLFLSWIDSRLQYKNLNQDEGLNLLSSQEKSTIWSPIVVFKNTNEKHKTIVDQSTYVQIKKYGNATLTPKSQEENAKLFMGDENNIIMLRYYREIFICE